MATVRQLDEPVVWIAGEEQILCEFVKLFSVTELAKGRTRLATDPETEVATLQLERTGLSTELGVTGFTAGPGTLEVGTPSEAGLLAGNTGLRTGQATLGVSTASLAVLGTETGQTTGLPTGVTTLEVATTHLTTRDVEPGPVTVGTVSSTLVAALLTPVLTPGPADLRPAHFVTLDPLLVSALQPLLTTDLTPRGEAALVGTVNSAQTEGERVRMVWRVVKMLRYSQGTLVTALPGLTTPLLADKVPGILPTRHHLPVTTTRNDLRHPFRTGSTVQITFPGALVAVLTARPHLPAHLLAPILLVSRVVGVTGELREGGDD